MIGTETGCGPMLRIWCLVLAGAAAIYFVSMGCITVRDELEQQQSAGWYRIELVRPDGVVFEETTVYSHGKPEITSEYASGNLRVLDDGHGYLTDPAPVGWGFRVEPALTMRRSITIDE